MATMIRRHWYWAKTQIDLIEALGSDPDLEILNRPTAYINYWDNISSLDKITIGTQMTAMNMQFDHDEEVEI